MIEEKGKQKMRFYQDAELLFREVKRTEDGSWLACCSSPTSAPFFVCKQNMEQFDSVEAPEEIVRAFAPDVKRTPAELKRLALIQPLLEDESCITDRCKRKALAESIAEKEKTTARRILRLFYQYLSTGVLMGKKQRSVVRNADFDWAINTFYFSSKKLSLRAAYELMLTERFLQQDGTLAPDAPRWKSFEHYYYRNRFHKKNQNSIARNGLSNFQRNERMIAGSSDQWRKDIGSYQMDATQADIYLVSRLDRTKIVGRPNIYMAVDTYSHLIAGIYVGFDAGESAVIACLVNAVEDKQAYCRRYGIEIDPEQWPCTGMPREIITDQGREFFSTRMDELCMRYDVEIQVMPPFRPDQKGIVEKTFDLLQNRYKPLLRGKGVIEPDAQERWATDYRTQALLNLNEFTAVVIHCVLYLNAGRMLKSGDTPAALWRSSDITLSQVDRAELYRRSLDRKTARMTRMGFKQDGLWYLPEDLTTLTIGDLYTIAYDAADTSEIYVVQEPNWIVCPLSQRSIRYAHMTSAEVEQMQAAIRDKRREGEQEQTVSSIRAMKEIKAIIQKAGRCDYGNEDWMNDSERGEQHD